MSEFKVECKNGDNLAVYAGGWYCIGIVKHALDVPGIYFNNKILDSNNKKLVGA